MPLPTVPCTGSIPVTVHVPGCMPEQRNLILECIKVNKVFDEFALKDCVEGIKFDLDRVPRGGEINPQLILKNCTLCDVEIRDVSTSTERRLRFSGKCCCEVFGKDKAGNLIRMRVVDIPDCTCNRLSIGPDGELCFSFSVRREYMDTTPENFASLIHFLDEGRFELQCLSEAVIDEENNYTDCECLVTNLGIFVAVKFFAEVQICVPVLGYCFIEEDIASEETFCERFDMEDIPSFNPPQLDAVIPPYGSC